MDKPVTFAICGLGIRGLEAYAAFQKQHPEKMKITAGADPDPDRRAALQANYGVPSGSCFATGEELLAQPRLADVMIIATQDRQHVAQALAALDKGYHLVLEKPISPLLDECLALQKKAHEANRVVVVCHVLRYTKFYGTLYELLRGGAIGRIESLDAVENVAYWHYAHSYVRGNWRRAEESSPMILAKSCHDSSGKKMARPGNRPLADGRSLRKRFLLRLSGLVPRGKRAGWQCRPLSFRLRL